MSNTILLKRSSVANAAPSTGNLSLGELAINTVDGRLFTKIDPGVPEVIDLTENQTITLSGDATGSGKTSISVTLASSQPNITSVGTLTSVSVTGNVTAGNIDLGTGNIIAGNLTVTGLESVAGLTVSGNVTVAGNLTVSGTTITANVENLIVSDPILGLGSGANGAPLTSDDGFDRGIELFYYTTQEQAAFIGRQDSTGYIIAASNVTVANSVVTVQEYGTFRAGDIEADTLDIAGQADVGNLSATNISGTLTTNSQPNITEVGTLISLDVTGNVTGGNIITLGNVDGNYILGNGAFLTGLPEQYGNANVEAYLPTYTGDLNPGNLTVSVLANITATTAATSVSTGALIVAGGVGVAGNIYADDVYKNGETVLNATDTIDGGTY